MGAEFTLLLYQHACQRLEPRSGVEKGENKEKLSKNSGMKAMEM